MSLLEGKRAIVTGGASGIGRATVHKLAEEGARVAIFDLNVDGAQAVCREVHDSGGHAIALEVDVSDTERIHTAVEEVAGVFGGLDILCNNAADLALLQEDRDFLQTAVDVWDRTWSADLRSVMAMCKFALPFLLREERSAIINVSSVDGTSGDDTRFAYCAAKAGVNVLTQCTATRYGRDGVRCNAVLPGLVLSPAATVNLDASPELKAAFVDNVLTPHLGRPEEVAAVIAFLASDAASYINGELIRVDGGLMSHVPHFAQTRAFFDGEPGTQREGGS